MKWSRRVYRKFRSLIRSWLQRLGIIKRGTPSSVLNELFSAKLDVCEGKEEIAEFGDYIRDRLRGIASAVDVNPPRLVTEDRPRKIHHDTLVKLVDVDPKSKAMSISFRGQPDHTFKRGKEEEEE